MPAMITLIAFLAVLIGLMAVWHYVMLPQRAMRQRLEQYVELSPAITQSAVALVSQKELTGWRATVRNMSRHFEWSGQSRMLRNKLIQAGLPLRGSEFAAIWAGSVTGCALLLFFISGGKPLMTSIGIAVGFILPLVFLRLKAAKRVRLFNDQLGDALVLVANSLRTGYSFLQAIEMVAREMPSPIAAEFGRVMKELNLGVTTETALNNMTERVGSEDLDLVVTAVLIQRQVGGNLAEVLDNIAGTIRERIKLKGEIRALTAQGRVSGLIVGMLPFFLGLVIYLINPGYMRILFEHPMGKLCLGVAFGSQIVGMLIVRKIVDIKL
ncbi:MAG: type II secretion system F family protein [Negativicutes bacterium]|nr:type II secretion system F family protein [Negativicutes bacterium]